MKSWRQRNPGLWMFSSVFSTVIIWVDEMDYHYKDVRNHLMHSNGTTAYETLLAIFPSSVYTFMTVLLTSLMSTYITKQKRWQFLIEFLVLILPIILNFTILAEHIQDILLTYFLVSTSIVLLIYNIKPSHLKNTCKNFNTDYITNVRSTTNVLSIVAILAVDFNIFPRYFAKTETFGYSLMDVGVGLYMFSNGIIAPEVRGHRDTVKKSIKSSIPLFILGGTRSFLTSQTDYNVPSSEYGIHWNFFITLGITKIFASFLLNIVEVKYVYINATFVLLAHEILLQSGLENIGLTNIKRDNFLLANKEGIISSLGYVALYLYSVYFGYLLDIKNNNQRKTRMYLKFIIGSLLTLMMSIILQYYFGISRRLANSAYCFWVLFIGIFMISIYYFQQHIMELFFKEKLPHCFYSPLIFKAVNYNGLIFFLLGNILTGLVNISFNTLKINNSFSLVILIVYMFTNTLVVYLLYERQIKFKI